MAINALAEFAAKFYTKQLDLTLNYSIFISLLINSDDDDENKEFRIIENEIIKIDNKNRALVHELKLLPNKKWKYPKKSATKNLRIEANLVGNGFAFIQVSSLSISI